MLKKLLVTTSVAGLAVGGAYALEIDNTSVGIIANGDSYPLAAELDYAGGAVVSDAAGDTRFSFTPSAGLFPTGNVLVQVTVTGATFDGALDGSEVSGTTTSVISSGGLDGGSTVTFLVSGANACVAVGTCQVDLPLELEGTDVAVAVGLETDAGAPVDNSSFTNTVSETIVQILPAFDIDFTPDTGATTADLNATNGPFTAFTGASDDDIGDILVAVNTDVNTLAVNTDFGGDPVVAGDLSSITAVISGSFDAFDPGAATNPGSVTVAGTPLLAAAVDPAADQATATLALNVTSAVQLAPGAAATVAIPRSDYSATVTVTPAAASDLDSGTTASGELQPIDRNGTQIIFPWTQSSTQGASSGVSSVFRIGNIDDSDTGAVFVEVRNSSSSSYVNPGLIEAATAIDANGELVVNSGDLEGLVGNYERGDVEFTVEAEPDTLTARQFVVRNGNVQQVLGGTIEQDVNN